MPTSGFHSEWVTIAESRVLLCCRASFPDDRMKLMAQVAVETCTQNSSTHCAAVVEVHFNDKDTIWTVTIVSTDESDKKLGPMLQGVLQTMLDNGNAMAEVIIVPEGDRNAANYDHMEYLSNAVGVAAGRWKHEEEEPS